MTKRWIESLENLEKANAALKEVADLYLEDGHNQIMLNIIRDSLIQRFEFTVELAHKTFNFYAKDQGGSHEEFAKQRVRKAAKAGLIENTQAWVDMINSRNDTSHNYDQKSAEEIVESIVKNYAALLNEALIKLQNKRAESHD
ncbi:HI0074 family nucleotidyltransferase substrate-binding subunit [Piscirickettsia salmonis]|uniref:HI0074 family nucleotidyltransferase substrate-binding subunit n=1 Tax=Piscirickettsia salmonis TaxID=1238 RepID=UPI0007C8D54B|nr:Nucleotidyltransferase substrate binding protein like protein [Piscirickettsiaceae bacterium NZ-RLO1]